MKSVLFVVFSFLLLLFAKKTGKKTGLLLKPKNFSLLFPLSIEKRDKKKGARESTHHHHHIFFAAVREREGRKREREKERVERERERV